MKRIVQLAIVVVILAVSYVFLSMNGILDSKEHMTAPSRAYYINDFSNVLSQDTKAFIAAEGKKLEAKTGAQVVVVTVKDTKGSPLNDYALLLARSWGIGQKDKDNGVLLLFTTEESQACISVGYGLEGALPDGRCGEILDNYAIKEVNNKEWNRGIVNTFRATAEQVYIEAKVDVPREIALSYPVLPQTVKKVAKVEGVAALQPDLYDKVFAYVYYDLLAFLPEEGKMSAIGLLFFGLLYFLFSLGGRMRDSGSDGFGSSGGEK